MKNGFGLLGIIIVFAVIASVAAGGGLYWNESKKQQSLLETGADAIKRAEELKKQIESRDESIYGGRTSINIDTSDWKTYRNEKYGLEIKYPDSWGSVIDRDSTSEAQIIFDPHPSSGTYFGLSMFVISLRGAVTQSGDEVLLAYHESKKYSVLRNLDIIKEDKNKVSLSFFNGYEDVVYARGESSERLFIFTTLLSKKSPKIVHITAHGFIDVDSQGIMNDDQIRLHLSNYHAQLNTLQY